MGVTLARTERVGEACFRHRGVNHILSAPNNEILQLLCKIQTGFHLSELGSLQELSHLPDHSQKAVKIANSGTKIYREAKRVLAPKGRLLSYDHGWYPLERNFLRKAGFCHFKAYRLVRKGHYLVELRNSGSNKPFFWERLLRSPLSVILLKLFPGHYFYSAGIKETYSDELFMRLNYRAIFSTVTKQGHDKPYLFIKASRPMAPGDFPLKEKFIIHWIHSQHKKVNLPEIQFDPSGPSFLFIRACPGHPLILTIDDLKGPDEDTKRKLTAIRRALENLSRTPPPTREKCQNFLEMLWDEPFQIRAEMFKDLTFDDAQCVVHGDLNPTNIIVDKNEAFIIDWERWRIGKRFENWFDFVIRSIWIAIKRKRIKTSHYILGQYKRLLKAPWIREQTHIFFENCGINDDIDQCLRYSLFLFLIDRIIKMPPARLKEKLENISVSNNV